MATTHMTNERVARLNGVIRNFFPYISEINVGTDVTTFEHAPLQRAILLDRYALKDAALETLAVDDLVVVVVKDDPKFPQTGFGVVAAFDDETVTIALDEAYGGEVVTKDRAKVTKPLEMSLEQMARRIAPAVASGEEDGPQREYISEMFEELLANADLIPGGRINFGAGNPSQVTWINCFVVPSPADSLEGISKHIFEHMKIMQKGGGIGSDMSTLRPMNSRVLSVDGKSSGAVSWMNYVSRLTPQIQQGGSRRGAQMKILRDTHPEVVLFALCKMQNPDRLRAIAKRFADYPVIAETALSLIDSKDPSRVVDPDFMTGANISVFVSDDFMDAVANDGDWTFLFPDVENYTPDEKERYDAEWHETGGDVFEWQRKGFALKSYGAIPAKAIKELFDYCAWGSAEPGVLFITQIQRMSNAHYYARLIATNPCLHKDSLMVTENGLEKISAMRSKIHNTEGFVESSAWKTGVKKVVRLMTKSGFEYVVTPDHRFLLENGEWEEAQNLIGKDIAFDCSAKEWNGFDPHEGCVNYAALGFILGDGGWHKASNRMLNVYATPDKDAEAIEMIEKELDTNFSVQSGKYTANIPGGTPYAETFVGKIEVRDIPDWILQLPKPKMRDFLKGLFSANGTNLKNYDRIQLVSINKSMLLKVQQMLLLFGIKAKLWYHNKAHDVEFANGTYYCKQSYHLVISRKSYEVFLDEIGFLQAYKNGYRPRNRKQEKAYETVILISEEDEAEVWDFHESELHRGICSGAIVHNCGEQPLPAYGMCTLAHVNYANMYDEATDDVDWSRLKRAIHGGIRFLDDVIDQTPLPLPEIEEMAKGERRIGLGIIGLADLFIKLRLPYGSDEMIAKLDEIMRFFRDESYRASIELAKEKGPFPYFDADGYLASGFVQTLPDDIREDIRKYGIRNVCLNTVAPTGTTGSMHGIGTGLEPYYAFEYFRSGRMGEFVPVKVAIAQEWFEANPDATELPPEFVSAQDIDVYAHLRVQTTVQRYIDSACSKTCNAPNSMTVEDVGALYTKAHEWGVKGVTVYRDGSRYEAVLTTEAKITEDAAGDAEFDESAMDATQACSIRYENGVLVKECS